MTSVAFANTIIWCGFSSVDIPKIPKSPYFSNPFLTIANDWRLQVQNIVWQLFSICHESGFISPAGKNLLESILGRKIISFSTLQRSSFALGDEKSLMILDLVVKLDDGAIINLEVQKIGYAFPGQRAVCYASDLMLRQYAQVKRDVEERRKENPKCSSSWTISSFRLTSSGKPIRMET